MRRLVRLALAAGCLSAIGCGSRTPLSLTHSSVLEKAGLMSYWQMALQLEPGERVDRIELLEENLYCLTNTNYLVAVDAAQGVRKWVRKVAEPGAKVYPLCHGSGVPLWHPKDAPATLPGEPPPMPGIRMISTPLAPDALTPFDLVFVNTADHMLAFDRQTGDLRRKITFDSRPDQFVASTGGSCDGQYYYVGSADGRCYAIRVNEGTIAWILATGEVLSAAPKCHNPGGSARVFVAGEDGELYVAKAGWPLSVVWPPGGLREWPAMAGPVTADFHVDDRACFIPCLNHRLYAFPLSGGPPIWRFTCQGALADPIQVSENTVFQYARDDRFYALNPANGKLRWAMSGGRKVLSAMPAGDVPMVYVVDGRKNLLVVDEILGKVRASIPLTGVDLFASNTSAPAVYVAGRDGRLYCLRQLDAPHLTSDVLRKVKAKPKAAPPASAPAP